MTWKRRVVFDERVLGGPSTRAMDMPAEPVLGIPPHGHQAMRGCSVGLHKPVIKGTRAPVQVFVGSLAGGMEVEERERREDGRRSSSEQVQELKRLQAKGFHIEWRHLPVKSDVRKTP